MIIKKINNQKDFENLCKSITKDDIVAFDLEFMRNKTFYPILCLIQINISDKGTYIIDPFLDNFNIKPFAKILQNRKIKKVLHSSFQDLIVLFQETKIIPRATFDTQIMANFLGFDFNISYAAIVKEFLNEEINKEQQVSNWKKRPLHESQIEYAAIDVKYLLKIYKIMESMLADQGKMKYFLKEMKNILKKKEYNLEKQDPFKKFSFINKNAQYQSSVTALVKWRDVIAREKDIPRSFVLKDLALDRMAKKIPDNISNLDKILNIYNINKKPNIKQDILNLLQKSRLSPKKAKKIKLEAYKMRARHQKIYQNAQDILLSNSEESKISSKFIINSPDLKDIILGNISLKKILFGWRYKIFGKDLKYFLKN